MLVLVLFTGCGSQSKEMKKAIAFRRELLNSNGCSFESEITVDYGMQTQLFVLSNQGDTMGNISFRVTYPESIEGISGRIDGSGGNLIFDDVILAFPLIAENQLSPVSASWILLKAMKSGNILNVNSEEKLLHMVIDDSFEDNSLVLDVWLDETGIPICADIMHEGNRILSITVKNFCFV